MDTQKLFYLKKSEVYFYVASGDLPLCPACQKEIDKNLVYHTVWNKKEDDVRTYHVSCFKKIHPRGYVDEFKTCVVVNEIPEDSLPIFERRPSLINKNGLNTFNVSEITKGSEAQIIDRTRIANDPHQSKMLDFEQNLVEFEKREEELGDSLFIVNDKFKDEFQITKKDNFDATPENNANLSPGKNLKESVAKVINKLEEKKKTVIRKRFYTGDLPKALDLEIFMGVFFENLRKSVILLPGQEPLKKLSSENSKPLLENKSES